MGAREKKFLEKKIGALSKIKYVTREGRKTVFHLNDGKVVETFNTIKGFLEEMPDDEFENINKGIVIGSRYVASVENNVYSMLDGTQFKGRIRITDEQKSKAEQYNKEMQEDRFSEFSILDEFPVAFCVIELVFDDDGHGVDFIFRYCNKAMEKLEKKTMDEMVDKSFYEVFENGDKKWLVVYADVALNGTSHVIEGYSPEIDENLRIYCYQPRQNYCACALIKKKCLK